MILQTKEIDFGKSILAEKENRQGKLYPLYYYVQGIKDVDSYMNGGRFYEFGFDFNIISFKNYVAMCFGDMKDDPIFYVERKDIINEVNYMVPHKMKIVYSNRVIEALKTGALGQGGGIAGMLLSSATGNMLKKIQGLKTEEIDGVLYCLPYYFNGSINKIYIEVPLKYQSLANNFFTTHWSKDSPSLEVKSDSNCFIATVCYENLNSIELITFRNFRDKFLRKYWLGRIIIKQYYKIGPTLAHHISKSKILRRNFRYFLLENIYQYLRKKGY